MTPATPSSQPSDWLIEIRGDFIANRTAIYASPHKASGLESRPYRTHTSMGTVALLTRMLQVIAFYEEKGAVLLDKEAYKHTLSENMVESSGKDRPKRNIAISAPIAAHIPEIPSNGGEVKSHWTSFAILKQFESDSRKAPGWHEFREFVKDLVHEKPSTEEADDTPDSKERKQAHKKQTSGLLRWNYSKRRKENDRERGVYRIEVQRGIEFVPMPSGHHHPNEGCTAPLEMALAPPRNPIYDAMRHHRKEERPKASHPQTRPKICFLSEHVLGRFDNPRHKSSEEQWSASPDQWPSFLRAGGGDILESEAPELIVFQCEDNVSDGRLLDAIVKTKVNGESLAGRTILVVAADSLRNSNVLISKHVSWEKLSQDTVWAILHNHHISNFRQFREVIVSFRPGGAVVFSTSENYPRSTQSEHEKYIMSGVQNVPGDNPGYFVIFSPLELEERFWTNNPGSMYGHPYALSYCIVLSAILLGRTDLSILDIEAAVKAGLMTIRDIHLCGFEDYSSPATEAFYFEWPYHYAAIRGFMNSVLMLNASDSSNNKIQRMALGDSYFASAPIDTSSRTWRILGKYLDFQAMVAKKEIHQVVIEHAMEIAKYGVERSGFHSFVPFGRFDKLIALDRQEVESIRSIRRLVRQYAAGMRTARSRQRAPLGIGLFGPPGSGKSFAVENILRSAASSTDPLVIEDQEVVIRTFDLSQIRSEEELHACFREVSNRCLEGKLPAVLWDEFDSPASDQKLGWLKLFLGPLQSGKYFQAGKEIPLGASIHFFAGGTSATYAAFGRGMSDSELRQQKVPDFMSRLNGYLNIIGLNCDPAGSLPTADSGYSHIFRRAICLRDFTSDYKADIYDDYKLLIDDSLLTAFLEVEAYSHGARSMQSIIRMSALANEKRFTRSNLPSPSQLRMHTDDTDFMEIILQEEADQHLRGVRDEKEEDGTPPSGYRLVPLVREVRALLKALGENPKRKVRQRARILCTKYIYADNVNNSLSNLRRYLINEAESMYALSRGDSGLASAGRYFLSILTTDSEWSIPEMAATRSAVEGLEPAQLSHSQSTGLSEGFGRIYYNLGVGFLIEPAD